MEVPRIYFLLLICLFCSCEHELSNTVEPSFQADVLNELEFSLTPFPKYQFQKEELARLGAYGFLGSSVRAMKRNSSSYESITYQIDGDILVDQEDVFNFIPGEENVGTDGDKHFRTRQIVGPSVREIIIVGVFPRADFVRGGRAETLIDGIELAAEAYDNLDIRISFRGLSVASSSRSASFYMGMPNTIIVWFSDELLDSNVAGKAEFPRAGGLPGKSIIINPIQSTRTVEQNARLLVHEIGHAIGFRHTDFFNRDLSCGPQPDFPSDEGQNSSGAIQIPGTPGFDYSIAENGASAFNSCSSIRTIPGFFFPLDVIALESLYPIPLSNGSGVIFNPTDDCEGQPCPCGEDCRCENGECVPL